MKVLLLFITGFLFAGCRKGVVNELSGKYAGTVTYGAETYPANFLVYKHDNDSFGIFSENIFNGKEADESWSFAYRQDGKYSEYRTSGYVEAFSAGFPVKDSLAVTISRWSSGGLGPGTTARDEGKWIFKGKKQ